MAIFSHLFLKKPYFWNRGRTKGVIKQDEGRIHNVNILSIFSGVNNEWFDKVHMGQSYSIMTHSEDEITVSCHHGSEKP
jgi:hypothetical protein